MTIRTALVALAVCAGAAPATSAPPGQGEWPKLLHTLKWYSEGLAFSPDGKTIAYAGPALMGNVQRLRDIFLTDVKTGKDVVHFKSQSEVQAVAFSPDGKLLASGGEDLRLWDVATGKLLRSSKTRVRSVAFSPDGKLLATGLDPDAKRTNKTVGLWEVNELKRIEACPDLTGEAKKLAFSPDGKTLAYGGTGGGEIGLWDVGAGKERARIDMGTQPKRTSVSFPSIAFSPDSKTLAVAAWYGPRPREGVAPSREWSEKDVHLWDVASGKYVDKFVGHEGDVRAVAFSPDGKLLASGGGVELKVWDVESKKVLATLKGAPDTIVFSPNGKFMVTAFRRGEIKLWSLERGK